MKLLGAKIITEDVGELMNFKKSMEYLKIGILLFIR